MVTCRIAKWVLVRKEFSSISTMGILFNWKACTSCGPVKQKRVNFCSVGVLNLMWMEQQEARWVLLRNDKGEFFVCVLEEWGLRIPMKLSYWQHCWLCGSFLVHFKSV